MRNPGGYGILTDPTQSRPEEHDTFTCKHCSVIVRVKAFTAPEDIGGLCKICMGLICPRCVGGNCQPWEVKLQIMEAKAAAQRSYGM